MISLLIAREGDSFFVQGEWKDQLGSHTKALIADADEGMLVTLEILMLWAEGLESKHAADLGNYEEKRVLEREIGMLQAKLDLLNRKR